MVLPIRESLSKRAVEHGVRPERIRVIPHGIDLSPFTVPPRNEIRSLFSIEANIRIISFVGRLSQDNYIFDILEAVRRLSEKRSDFIFVMVGSGKLEGEVNQRLKNCASLDKHIIMTGFQPREVCFDLRRASEVSLCLMGGFSLIEACAAGTPVVSYDVEWHEELVKSGETGFLVKENDIEGVVTALDWLLDNAVQGQLMGQKAKALAFERHSLSNATAAKIRWYLELLPTAS